jgi:EF-P beta-lysylation protein EpmB
MLRTLPLSTNPTWQEQLADLVTDPQELLTLLQLDAADLPMSEQALREFPLRVPRPYLARMRPGDPRDPLLLQVLPQAAEALAVAGYTRDPLGEADVNHCSGLLHKYAGRALLITTQSCAIHCRYCFRRHFPYSDNKPGRQQWQQSLRYIADNPDIAEVILSGGDPLACSNTYLQWLLQQISTIPHVIRIRLHSRVPIMLPARVDAPLLELLQQSGRQLVMVLHANHANEFDAEVDAACARMRAAGLHLLNQSVLLQGINDDANTLAALSERLFAAGVLPYYLHMLDRVQGAAHFAVSELRAFSLLSELQARLPGYLVPRLVREEAGKPGKTPLIPAAGRQPDD